jgi:hypothetical protein
MGTSDIIKDISYSDYRLRIPGVICTIIEVHQYVGFGAILKVRPEDYDMKDIPEDGDVRYFNVACAGTPGVYGFPTLLTDNYNAYVMTNNPSMLDGKIAILVPKTFLNRSVGSKTNTETVNKDALDDLIMKKDSFIKARRMS